MKMMHIKKDKVISTYIALWTVNNSRNFEMMQMNRTNVPENDPLEKNPRVFSAYEFFFQVKCLNRNLERPKYIVATWSPDEISSKCSYMHHAQPLRPVMY